MKTSRPARRSKKSSKSTKTTGVFGAVVVEVFAIAIFAFLVVQARAERQEASAQGKAPELFVIQEMFSQTPFSNVLAQSNSNANHAPWGSVRRNK